MIRRPPRSTRTDTLFPYTTLFRSHQRGHVTHRADIDLAARQERHRARKIDGEAALHAAEDHAFDALLGFKLLFKRVPCGFAAGAVASKQRAEERCVGKEGVRTCRTRLSTDH